MAIIIVQKALKALFYGIFDMISTNESNLNMLIYLKI